MDNDYDENSENSVNPDDYFMIGTVLKDIYILLNKIGSGNNAIVWMTYDIFNNIFIAMKIQDDQCYQDGCREITIIQRINEYCKQNNNININCVTMLDYFIFMVSNNVKYVCSTYELYAGNIYMILHEGKYKYGLPLHVVKQIMRQLLFSLSVLHDKLHIIHTDIKPENILFKGSIELYEKIYNLFYSSGFLESYKQLCIKYNYNKDIKMKLEDKMKFSKELDMIASDSVTEIMFIELVGDNNNNEDLIPDNDISDEEYIDNSDDYFSEEFEDVRVVNTRKQSVDDIFEYLDYDDIHDMDDETEYEFERVLNNREMSIDKEEIVNDKYILNCEIAITDFGNSYFYKKRTRHEIQTRFYRAPEIILDLNYSYPSDVWSAACIAFELATGFVLFEVSDIPLNKDINHLYLIEKMIGDIPIKMKKLSKRKKFLFDNNYNIRNIESFRFIKLRDRLIKQFLFNESDANEFSNFLLAGLQIDPSLRLSAKELLDHKWLK